MSDVTTNGGKKELAIDSIDMAESKGKASDGGAAHAMTASASGSLGASILQRKINRRRLDRRSDDANGVSAGAEHAVASASASSGSPLPGPIQRKFEGSLGADLSAVRVHSGEGSASAADSVSARAYTVGNDIHFGQGQYNPTSSAGEHLLAHEVAHTVQQSSGGASRKAQFKLDVSAPGDGHEVEADHAADAMVQGAPVSISSAPSVISRKGEEDKKDKKEEDPVETAAKKITSLLSYGIFDWAITDGDAMDVVNILTKMTSDQRRQVLVKIGSKYVTRLVENIPPEKAHLFAGLTPREDVKKDKDGKVLSLDEQIKTEANNEQATVALAELRLKQATDKNNPKRITDGLVELLVFGVARATHKGNDLGKKGVIGIDAAINAADALIAMPIEAYLQIIAKLVMTGGDDKAADAKVESVLILKAVGARKDEFTKGDKKAADDVAGFADKIRGQDAEKLKDKTSTADKGGADGLQQKYTMSCGPTSIQITHGEVDPIFAMEVNDKAKHNLDYSNSVAGQQKDYLGKKDEATVPRAVEDDYGNFNKWVPTVAVADKPKVLALTNWISGKPADAKVKDEGAALAIAAGYKSTRLDEFKKYFAYFGNAPGWGNDDFAKKAGAELGGVTAGGKFAERAIPPQYKALIVGGSPVYISTVAVADVDALYNKLFRGTPVPMGIMWTNGGGHFMVFTDTRKKDDGSGKMLREFMLSDPWEGKSAWITEANVLTSDLAPFGKGAIDSFYL